MSHLPCVWTVLVKAWAVGCVSLTCLAGLALAPLLSSLLAFTGLSFLGAAFYNVIELVLCHC